MGTHERTPAWAHALLPLVTMLVLALATLFSPTAPALANSNDDAPQLEITRLEELVGHPLGNVSGSVFGEVTAKHVVGVEKDDFLHFKTLADEIAALKSRKIDGFAQDEPVARLATARNQELGIIPQPIAQCDYGFIFPKGSALAAQFDEVIERLRDDGTLETLKAEWTGPNEAVKDVPDQDWPTPNGTLTMAVVDTQEPMAYLSNGHYVGYDVELALLCCKKLGYGLDIRGMDVAHALPAVKAGDVSFGGGGISITKERGAQVDFSTPTYQGSIVAVVRAVDYVSANDLVGRGIAQFHTTFIAENRWQIILSGLCVTAIITTSAGLFGMLVGIISVFVQHDGPRWAQRLVRLFQAMVGRMPVVVVLMALYYIVFGSVNVSGTFVAILTFTLAFGAVSGRIMWKAIENLGPSQEESGLALGYTKDQVLRKILLPQAATAFMPQLANLYVTLFKDTSIVGYIAVQDLTRASDFIRSRTMDAFFPIVSTAIIYFLISLFLTWLLRRIVARLDMTNRPRRIEGVEP